MIRWPLRYLLLGLIACPSFAASQALNSEPAELHKIITIEDHRESQDPFLQTALDSPSVPLQARALLALGRIGDPATAQQVQPFLKNSDPILRTQAAFALGLIKNPDSLTALQKALLLESQASVRAQLYMAIGRLQLPVSLDILSSAMQTEKDPEAQSGLAMGLCYRFLAPDAAQLRLKAETVQALLQALRSPAPLAVSAAWALARFKGELQDIPEDDLRMALARTQDTEAQAIAIKALARHKTALTQQVFTHLLKEGESSAIRIEAALALQGQVLSEESLKALLAAASLEPFHVQAAALISLASLPAPDERVVTPLRTLSQNLPSSWLQGLAYQALTQHLTGEARRSLILEALQHRDPYVLRQAMTLLPLLGEEGLALLLKRVDDPSLLIAGAAVSVLTELDAAQLSPGIQASLLRQLGRHDPVITSLVITAAGKFKWKDALPQLLQAAAETWKLDEYVVQESLMTTLASFADPKTLPIIEKNLQHPVRSVVLQAREAWEKLSGKKLETPIPLNHRVEEETPSLLDIEEALRSEIDFETSQGLIRVAMLDVAPLTASKVVRWVKSGFYNGLSFHRVVPHWVVQGGDPRGDGEGGDGLIRDEVSQAPHLPFTLGIATAGKDTGSTQIFFNRGNNTRLDGSYTVFARIVSGQEVVERLGIGDKILKATVRAK